MTKKDCEDLYKKTINAFGVYSSEAPGIDIMAWVMLMDENRRAQFIQQSALDKVRVLIISKLTLNPSDLKAVREKIIAAAQKDKSFSEFSTSLLDKIDRLFKHAALWKSFSDYRSDLQGNSSTRKF
jgi:hypothetical protein